MSRTPPERTNPEMGRLVPLPPRTIKLPKEVRTVTAKNWCGYCPGDTFDDEKGHCIACGGPRDEEVSFASRNPAVVGENGPEMFYPSTNKVVNCASTSMPMPNFRAVYR